jgi:putative ABC transport system permease protein
MVFLSAISLIIISLIGIFALATFELDQRWKELSIRKVLGASFFDLFKHVNGRLLTILATANLIALPLAYYYTHSWLAAFAYRINTPYGLYVLTAILNIVTALVISNIRIARIITLKPVEKLKLDH